MNSKKGTYNTQNGILNCEIVSRLHWGKKSIITEQDFIDAGIIDCSVISSYSFTYMHNLEEIHLPRTVKQIDRFAFSCCDNLKTIWFPFGFRETNPIKENATYSSAAMSMHKGSLDAISIANCPNLKDIYIDKDDSIELLLDFNLMQEGIKAHINVFRRINKNGNIF